MTATKSGQYAQGRIGVGKRHDVNNHLIEEITDPDGAGSEPASEQVFLYDRGQMVLRYTGTTGVEPTVADYYVWGPATDLLLCDEHKVGPSRPTSTGPSATTSTPSATSPNTTPRPTSPRSSTTAPTPPSARSPWKPTPRSTSPSASPAARSTPSPNSKTTSTAGTSPRPPAASGGPATPPASPPATPTSPATAGMARRSRQTRSVWLRP